MRRRSPRADVAPLRELAQSEGVSLFMVLLAGFKALLHRYTGAEDVVVGAPVSGRHLEEIAPLLGFFSNTLALRTDLSGDPSFAELLERVRETMLGALTHQELPFEKLVEVLNPERARSHSPIFQVLFGYDIVNSRRRALAGASAEQVPVPGWESARFDLSIIVHDLPDGALHLNVGYATDVFDGSTIERLIGHYRTLLEAVGRDPGQPLSHLELLTPPSARRCSTTGTRRAGRTTAAACTSSSQSRPHAHRTRSRWCARTSASPTASSIGARISSPTS